MSVRGWFFGFDWSRSGGYGGPLEDVSGYVTDDDLSITVGRDTSQASSDIPAGTLGFAIVEKDLPGAFKFAPEATTSVRNSNSDFEYGISGWTGFGGSIVQTNFLPHQGGFCLKLTPDGVSATSRTECDPVFGAASGQSWRADAWVKCEVSRNITANINWFNSSAGYLSTTNGSATAVTANVWTQITVSGTAPASAARASLSIDMNASPPITHVLYVDEAVITGTVTPTSAIAGLVKPGVPVTFNTTVAGATTTLFTGTLDKLTYTPHPPATLSGTVMDSWGKPGAEKLSTTVYTGMRTGDLINVVLDAIAWTGGRDIDPGATVVPFWWEEGTDAATAVQKLIDSEGPPAIGYVYAGTFVFRDRHHRILDAPSLTSQGTFTHSFPEGTGSAGDFKMATGSFSYDHGLSSIVNTASFTVDVRTIGEPIAVWQTDSPISVAAGVTITYTINANDPFVNAQVPIPVSGFDSSGNPISGDYVLAYGSIASIDISRTSGQSLILTIVGGATDALFTRMQVQANPVIVANSQTISVVDAGSVASKGTLTWPAAAPWVNVYDAYAIAQHIVSVYASARPVMTFEIDGLLTNAAAVSYMTQFVARQVSDRITVRHDLIGFNGDCHIEKIERVVRSLGKNSSLLRLTVEPVDSTGAANPFTFNVAGRGFNDGQFDADGISNPASVFRFDVAGHGFNQGLFAS